MVNVLQQSVEMTPLNESSSSSHEQRPSIGRDSDGRSVTQQPSGIVATVKGLVSSFPEVVRGFFEIVGAICGCAAAFTFSVATMGIAPIVWNGSADNNNDMFTAFFNAGRETGKTFGKFITYDFD